jgi:glutathionylspermidine synthase
VIVAIANQDIEHDATKELFDICIDVPLSAIAGDEFRELKIAGTSVAVVAFQ